MNQKTIYFDNAATTRVSPKVFKSMMPFFQNSYGNPSTIYSLGREARQAIEVAREKIANSINADKEEIFFTGSGTESDNWAIKGIAYANRKKGNHIITTNIEHHAILNTCKNLERNGFEVTYVPVEKNGIVNPKDILKEIRKDTVLISVMFANNEIGTLQPIVEIGKITKENGIYFHTDAVQAVGNIKIDVNELNIDLLSLSAHKLNGPKGVGALYIRKGVKIENLIHGGGQENRMRAGTENVASIVGLGKAIELATEDIEGKAKYLTNLREKAIKSILENIPHTIINGDRERRLPGNINVCFEYIEGESILLLLDSLGICASSGSACTSGSLNPSHVLLAIGLPHEIAHGSLRLSFSKENTEEEVDFLLEKLPPIISRLRDMSPLYTQVKK
ncbi:cysteine desulfurase NifS [Candidatus Dojkabacteria bacterium]|uniref:Cysteine desulfurase IscS n=1 Tax=Candidatus Dojkabacteria bacterium TaxID=2099670 RepID=A0A847D244_9BACT|nr:cysteine desulfurase NifS [Candidatus Dojkabacteria bacterium]